MSIVNDLKLNNLQNFARENYIPVVQENSCNFLHEVVADNKPKQILEIGTAIGYSGIVLLNASPKAHLTTIELDEKRFKMATKNLKEFGLKDRVTQILGDAKQVLKTLQPIYDFVFLDGPKGQYYAYLPMILDVLKPNGLIFCDNINFNGMVDNGLVAPHKHRTIVNNLRKFKTEIISRQDLVTKLYDVGDGVAVIRKQNR